MSSNLGHRITSAPYRSPENYPAPSQYHKKCSSAKSNVLGIGENVTNLNYEEYQKNSVAVQDEIWKHSCWKEATRQTKWQQTWGFLKDYDQKGNIKAPEEPLDVQGTVFSEKLPNTSNGNYGQRLQSPSTNFIKRLERTSHNLRKNEEIVYCE